MHKTPIPASPTALADFAAWTTAADPAHAAEDIAQYLAETDLDERRKTDARIAFILGRVAMPADLLRKR